MDNQNPSDYVKDLINKRIVVLTDANVLYEGDLHSVDPSFNLVLLNVEQKYQNTIRKKFPVLFVRGNLKYIRPVDVEI
eukprot:TRINITY_DN3159_c3_g2_i1.p1 TRINITY_DN3159_c3_g2~~TRINITY_DN3159_c3_g2_i1.p1  ORF type:complete len:89 (+),score=24.71 TRINITY_DN3159_c3_g2_i1:36-269(+)